jgi:chitodextrinase
MVTWHVGIFLGVLGSSAYACPAPETVALSAASKIENVLPLQRPVYDKPTGISTCPWGMWPYSIPAVNDTYARKVLAMTPPPAGALAPAWQSSTVYQAGQVASYNGRNYRAKWWTTAEVPGVAASGVWEEMGDAYGNPAAWSSKIAYVGGAKVLYDGLIYQAKWWTQGEIPTPTSTTWAVVGLPNPKFPALFTLIVNAKGQATWQTDIFQETQQARSDRWKLYVNGVVVQQGTVTQTETNVCPPTSPGACIPGTRQSGALTIPIKMTDQVSFWLCAGTNVCRPTPRITWALKGYPPAP